MRICPACKTKHESDLASTCRACGHPLGAPETEPPREDDLEFRVYEKESDDREFVGGSRDFEDDADERKAGASGKAEEPVSSGRQKDPDFAPITASEACVPEPFEEPDEPLTGETVEEESPLTASGKIKRLSEEEVKSIAGSLYRNDAFLNDKDKQELMKKLDNQDQLFAASAPIQPPKRAKREKASPKDVLAEIDEMVPLPKMAGRGRGIAYFYRNLIQLQGSQQLFAGDEIVIGERQYELRRKTISRTTLLVGGGALFLLLLIILGSLFVSDPSGEGQVAGVVIDESQVPLSRGVSVVFPDLAVTCRVNGQGMFSTENLPAGSHRVEVVRDGKTYASDYVTVSGGEISLIALRPAEGEDGLVEQADFSSEPIEGTVSVVSQPPAASQAMAKPAAPPVPKPTMQVDTKKANQAALTLAANVEGAKLVVDGKVLGAGNLTYNQLTPGTHSYVVSREGYASASGTITLAPDKTQMLQVTLKPVAETMKQQEYSVDDYYLSGISALQEMDYEAAVSDLTQVVNREPGNSDAWSALGKAQAGLKDWSKAHDSFLRSAEILSIGKEFSKAISAYNEAINCSDKSVPAYLGRGDLFLRRGDERAAAIDFETAVRLDRRNPQAYIGLGKSRLNQGLTEEALKNFKDARSLDPANPIVYQHLMLCYMAENNFDEVRRSYEKFTEVANDEQIRQLQSDQRFSAALRVANGPQ